MKNIAYKLFIGVLFSVFGLIAKYSFSEEVFEIKIQLNSKEFWMNFMIFFGVGYVLLGNVLLNVSKKNKN